MEAWAPEARTVTRRYWVRVGSIGARSGWYHEVTLVPGG